MARKPTSFIPPNGQRFAPPLEEQRAMVEEQIIGFRRQGYSIELQIEAFEAQDDGSDGEKRDKMLIDLRAKRDNCWKSARHFEAKLAAMPMPKKPKPAT